MQVARPTAGACLSAPPQRLRHAIKTAARKKQRKLNQDDSLCISVCRFAADVGLCARVNEKAEANKCGFCSLWVGLIISNCPLKEQYEA